MAHEKHDDGKRTVNAPEHADGGAVYALLCDAIRIAAGSARIRAPRTLEDIRRDGAL